MKVCVRPSKFEQAADPLEVELGIDIVKQEERIFAPRARKTSRFASSRTSIAPLLARGAVFPDVVPVECDLKFSTVAARSAPAGDDLGLNTHPQPLGEQCLIVGKVALALKR